MSRMVVVQAWCAMLLATAQLFQGARAADSASTVDYLGEALRDDAECSGLPSASCAFHALQRRSKPRTVDDIVSQAADSVSIEAVAIDPVATDPVAAEAAASSTAPISVPVVAPMALPAVAEGAALVEDNVATGGCPGFCKGSSMCGGKSRSACETSIFGCSWQCQWFGQSGVCTGGSMCNGKSDASQCETSIFGCKWSAKCSGTCSGSSMCRGKSQSDCVNSIFGCSWKCDAWWR